MFHAMDSKRNIEPADRPWGIREFAEKFDVTPRTLRFYEDKGLLTPSRDGNVRLYTSGDGARLEQIMRGKRLGFSLEDIKEVLDVTDGHIHDRIDLLRRKKNFVKVIQSLKRRREDISALAKEMKDVCDFIEECLENTSDREGVFDLAGAYEKKFRQTLMEDDLSEPMEA